MDMALPGISHHKKGKSWPETEREWETEIERDRAREGEAETWTLPNKHGAGEKRAIYVQDSDAKGWKRQEGVLFDAVVWWKLVSWLSCVVDN